MGKRRYPKPGEWIKITDNDGSDYLTIGKLYQVAKIDPSDGTIQLAEDDTMDSYWICGPNGEGLHEVGEEVEWCFPDEDQEATNFDEDFAVGDEVEIINTDIFESFVSVRNRAEVAEISSGRVKLRSPEWPSTQYVLLDRAPTFIRKLRGSKSGKSLSASPNNTQQSLPRPTPSSIEDLHFPTAYKTGYGPDHQDNTRLATVKRII